MVTDDDQVAVVVTALFFKLFLKSNLGARLADLVGAAKTFSSVLGKLAWENDPNQVSKGMVHHKNANFTL